MASGSRTGVSGGNLCALHGGFVRRRSLVGHMQRRVSRRTWMIYLCQRGSDQVEVALTLE